MDICGGGSSRREVDIIRYGLLKMISVNGPSAEVEMTNPAQRESHCCDRREKEGSDNQSYQRDHRQQQYCSSNRQCNSPVVPKSLSTANIWSMLLYTFFLVTVVALGENTVSAYGDPVYIRKVNGFQQLLSSDTLRWFKQGTAKDPLQLIRPNLEPAVICRVWHTSLRGVGLVSDDQTVCNISTQEGAQGSDKYQTLSTSASRLVWKMWQRPNPPPIGAVAISFKPEKFLATDLNSTVIGYLDPLKNLGSAIFPNEQEPASSGLVLTEVEPERYELSSVQLKRNKGFIEEDIVLAYGRLKYDIQAGGQTISGGNSEPTGQKDWSAEQGDETVVLKPESNELGSDVGNVIVGDMGKKGKVESILSYETNSLDNWGQGYLMAKMLHTSIKLDDGSTKTIEWGIPSTQAGKTETMTAVAELAPGTGMNVTLRGTRIDGEMSYWATLKTIFKDGSSSTRLLEGHRRIKDIQDIRLEHSKIYFLFNDSVVPDPTTTTTTTTTTPLPISEEEDKYDDDEDGTPQTENALPVESRNEFLADQGHTGGSGGFMVSNSDDEKSNFPSASIAHSGGDGLAVSASIFTFLAGFTGVRIVVQGLTNAL